MKTLSLSDAKAKLSGLVKRVNATDEEIFITKNGRVAAVLMSMDEYEGWKETVEIQSNPAMMKEITRGLAALKRGDAKIYDNLEELFDEPTGK